MTLRPWLALFRLPNLPTAPGDALAGAALACFLGSVPNPAGSVPNPVGSVPIVAAGASALFLYMYGLADNDIVGASADAVTSPSRPIPSGRISLRAARLARGLLWGLSLLVGAVANLPPAWWGATALLLISIIAYNRIKDCFLMGLCRGLSAVAGATAVVAAGGWNGRLLGGVLGFAVGEMVYVAAVTKLSEGEERASEGFGNRRYLLGITSFMPLISMFFVFNLGLSPSEWGLSPIFRGLSPILPVVGCGAAFCAWCAAVGPLWMAHGPDVRRAAVGRTIGALLYIQVGFMLLGPSRVFLALAVAVWLAARFVRRLAPEVSGS